MRCRSSTTFTSSSDGPFSLPHPNTQKVGFAERLVRTSECAVALMGCHNVRTLPPPDSEGVFGRVPQGILDDESSHLTTAHENSLDLQNMLHVSENAYKQYLKSRPEPSPESFRRVKNTDMSSMAVHPLLGESEGGRPRKKSLMMVLRQWLVNTFLVGLVSGSGLEKMELERLHIVDAIKGYKAKSVSDLG